ncbi:homeobox protein ceh-13-like [Bolinopsis microptera]|uniref:homeobox protein ceh-13-like n=1 Tax=Bolinopsis microptera TaxID=2820187 RepID=UPI003079935C
MSSFEEYLNNLFSLSTPPPNHLPNYPTPVYPTPVYPTPVYPTPVCPTPTYPVPSYPTSYHSLGYSYLSPGSYYPGSYLTLPAETPYQYSISPEITPLKPPSPSTSQYCSFSSTNTSTLETPTFTPEPVATSTPAFPLSPNHVTPPPTPGKQQISSPPRFFFPPDFSLPNSGNTEEVPSGAPLSKQTPSSFGKTQRRRRHRTKFTICQTSALEAEFSVCSYISAERRRELSEVLGIKELTIRVWFQNRRTQEKKKENNRPTHSSYTPSPTHSSYTPSPTHLSGWSS